MSTKLEDEIAAMHETERVKSLPIPADAPQPQISPEKYIWEKHVIPFGFKPSDYLKNPYSGDWTFCDGITVIGYCQSARLKVRPRVKGYSVMLETEDGEQFWTHLPDDYGNAE